MVTTLVVDSSFELFSFRAILFFSHSPTPIYSLISLQGISLRYGSFSSAEGLFWVIECLEKS